MPDSSLKPQAPSTVETDQRLADTRRRANKALVDPDFTPGTLPDGVLLELVTLAYREHQADRLRETADELLRRLGLGAPVTVTHSKMNDLAVRLEAVEARLTVLEWAERTPSPLPDPADTAHDSSGYQSPSVSVSDEGAPVGRLTRDVIDDVLMTALELSLSVGQSATKRAPWPAEGPVDDHDAQDPDDPPTGIQEGEQPEKSSQSAKNTDERKCQ